MNIEQLRAAHAWIAACLRAINDGAIARGADITDAAERATAEALTEDEATRWAEGRAELARLESLIERHNEVARASRTPEAVEPGDGTIGAPNANNRGGRDPFDLSEVRMGADRDELRDRALEAVAGVDNLDDEHREATERLLRRHETPTGALSRHILSTGSPAYRSAWRKLVAGRPEMMTQEEGTAIQAARALALTPPESGGHAVPFTLDPTIIDTRDGSKNPMRDIATVRTTVTDQWAGVTSSGMTVTWGPEGSEVPDGSPEVDQPNIPVHKAHGFALGSIEISQDWAGLEADLRDMISRGKDDAEAIVFAVGTGDDQPTGLVTALAAAPAGAGIIVPAATVETFTPADIYALENALGDRYLANAHWMGHRAVFNLVRQLDEHGGSNMWERIGAAQPAELIGYPVARFSAMANGFTPGVEANNYLAVLGDPRDYTIVDRVGLTVEYVPHVFGPNRRPTGQRGWYCYWRVGGDAVNANAFRMLNVPTVEA